MKEDEESSSIWMQAGRTHVRGKGQKGGGKMCCSKRKGVNTLLTLFLAKVEGIKGRLSLTVFVSKQT